MAHFLSDKAPFSTPKEYGNPWLQIAHASQYASTDFCETPTTSTTAYPPIALLLNITVARFLPTVTQVHPQFGRKGQSNSSSRREGDKLVTAMGTVTVKSGEQLRIIRVAGPDAEWKEPIMKALGHKGGPWVGTIRMTLEQSLEGVQCYYYLGLLDEEIVGNITSTEAIKVGVGILGHVFTSPSHRRKGICTALMEALTGDFAARGGGAMTLATGYDSPPYHIYASFGFQGVGKSTAMIWEAQPDFVEQYFSAGPTEVRNITWPDWALLDMLYKTEPGSFLRSIYFTHYGPSSYESLFPQLLSLAEENEDAQAKVLAKPGGEVVGHALLVPDPRWHND
ncbi:MAG: GNAT family N-acetyltransferase, partial [Armatimonadetes bacterium]|nr:GNAT family N-acetyltransferase [Armatimonadota bacterium]